MSFYQDPDMDLNSGIQLSPEFSPTKWIRFSSLKLEFKISVEEGLDLG